MNILVSAAALRTSGARTIYLQFINHLKTRVDGNHYFIMVDKSMEMLEIEGVEYWMVDVISNRDKEAMADAICRLIEDPELLKRMGNNSKQISRQYSKEMIFPHWPMLFESL